MSKPTTQRQQLLPVTLEETRLAKIERLLGKAPRQLTTAARMFDERGRH